MTGAPLHRGTRGNCPRCPPLNPALALWPDGVFGGNEQTSAYGLFFRCCPKTNAIFLLVEQGIMGVSVSETGHQPMKG